MQSNDYGWFIIPSRSVVNKRMNSVFKPARGALTPKQRAALKARLSKLRRLAATKR